MKYRGPLKGALKGWKKLGLWGWHEVGFGDIWSDRPSIAASFKAIQASF